MGVFGSAVPYAWQRVSGLLNTYTSANAIAVPATVAVLKTDTNKVAQLICFLFAFAFSMLLLFYVCRLLLKLIVQTVSMVSTQGTLPDAKLMAFIGLVIYTIYMSYCDYFLHEFDIISYWLLYSRFVAMRKKQMQFFIRF